MLGNFQHAQLPAFTTLMKLPKDEMKILVAKTLARVNIEQDEILRWVNQARLEKLVQAKRSIPTPPMVLPKENTMTASHKYVFIGDSSLTLYSKGGKKVTLKTDLSYELGVDRDSIQWDSLSGAGIRLVTQAVGDHMQRPDVVLDGLCVSYMMNDAFNKNKKVLLNT